MCSTRIEAFMRACIGAGWHCRERPTGPLSPALLPLARYPALHVDHRALVERIGECVAPDEKSWLVCLGDFLSSEAAFTWDAWEQISADAAEGDPQLMTAVVTYWDRHCPLLMSVRGEYAYLAIVVSGADVGRVVYGYEPELEESAIVWSSLGEFLEDAVTWLEGRPTEGEQARILERVLGPMPR